MLLSVDEAVPVEEGGSQARKGFNYQDEVAVGFLLDMLLNPSVVKVHCETHDDLLVVCQSNGCYSAEYVQVKGAQGKLWSVADICRRDQGKIGTSIFETSLHRDRHIEVSLFRIVTLQDVAKELSALKLSLGHESRAVHTTEVANLIADINVRCPGAKSEKKNDASFWIEHCLWDVRYDLRQVQNENFTKLVKLAGKSNQTVLPEHVENLLNDLRAKVKTAGAALWKIDKQLKIIKRTDLISWWEEQMSRLASGASEAGGKLAEKLEDIGADATQISAAVELRRRYAAAARTPRYMADPDTDALQEKVQKALTHERAKLAAGYLNMNGQQFLVHCIDEVEKINSARPAGKEDRSVFLQGCMYDITDRCLHKFVKPNL